jgi:TonB family protein
MSKQSELSAESSANAPPRDLDASPATASKPSANPESSPAPNGSNGLTASRASENPDPELSHSPVAVTPPAAAPGNPGPHSGKPVAPAPYRSRPSAILVNVPAEGSKPSTVLFPEKPIAVSSSLAITSQLSVVVYPEPGPAAAHPSARLQAGDLVFYAEPRYPRTVDRDGMTETVKVRATIGPQGQVVNVKPLSGPASLRPAAVSAVREWRYSPTLLNGKPVQAQQDVTIEFRPYH